MTLSETGRDLINQMRESQDSSINSFKKIINNDGYKFEKFFMSCVFTKQIFLGYDILIGNFGSKNTIKGKILTWNNFCNEKINNGSAQGKIDIVLKNDKDKNIFCFTCKYFESNDVKNIDSYDVSGLLSTSTNIKKIYPSYQINYGIVTNCYSEDLKKKLKNSRSSFNYKMKNNYTLTELEPLFKGVVKKFKEMDDKQLSEFVTFRKISNLDLRYYQQYIVEEVAEVFKRGNTAVLSALPRIGKTYIAGEIISQFSPKKVCYISNVVNNLRSGLEDFFSQYSLSTFKDYSINVFGKQISTGKKYKIDVISVQSIDLVKTKKEIYDLFIFDEAHIGGVSIKAEKILKKFSNNNTKILYMTATAKKIIFGRNMKNKTVSFGMTEVSTLYGNKDRRDTKLYKKIVKKIGREILDDELDVIRYPKMFFKSLKLEQIYKEKLVDITNTDTLVNFWTNSFTIENEKFTPEGKILITRMFDRIFKNRKDLIDQSYLKEISRGLGFIPKLILVYLPCGIGKQSEYVTQNTKKLFDKTCDPGLYNSLSFHSGSHGVKDIKQEIVANIEENKTLVVFVCRMLETAITLEDCAGIILLDDIHSEDINMQRIYRPGTFIEGKENIFILDVNPLRTINVITDYIVSNNDISSLDDIVKQYKLIENIIHFNKNDFGFDEDDMFYRYIVNNYYTQMVTVDRMMNMIQDMVEIDKENLKFLGKISSLNRIALESRNEEIENKTFTNSSSSSQQEKTEDTDSKDKESEEEKIKKIKNIIQGVLYRLIIWNINKSFLDIYDPSFEEKIDRVLTNHYGCSLKYPSFIKILMSYDQDLLSRLFIKIKMEYLGGNVTKKYEIIEGLLKPSEYGKKNNGEVFTPLSLVNDMLDKLPNDVWSNPNLKWLDPAVGIGNFPLVVYLRLLESLTSIPIESRSKHILENMLFACDICPINCSIYESILGKTNFKCISFFDYTETGYDIIMGNPPYNDGSGNKGKGHTLWSKFIEKSLEILKEDGYLCFVNPSLWRQIDHPLFKMMTKYQILNLEIHGTNDGQKTFRCSTRYDWYVLHKKPVYTNTVIKDEDGLIQTIYLKKWKFLPNKMYKEISEITAENIEKLEANYYRSNYASDKSHTSKTSSNEFKYPVIYTINKANVPTLIYSSRNDKGHFGISKFIFSNGAGYLCDPEGKYGLSEWAYCIYDTPENLESVQKVFLNKKFKKIIEAIHLSSATYNIKIMKLFKKDFYKEFL